MYTCIDSQIGIKRGKERKFFGTTCYFHKKYYKQYKAKGNSNWVEEGYKNYHQTIDPDNSVTPQKLDILHSWRDMPCDNVIMTSDQCATLSNVILGMSITLAACLVPRRWQRWAWKVWKGVMLVTQVGTYHKFCWKVSSHKFYHTNMLKEKIPG